MITPEQIEQRETFSYFWDPGEGWEIREYHTPMVTLSALFEAPGGPSVREIQRIRQWLPELAALSPAEAKAMVGMAGTYVAGDFVGHQGKHLIERARDLGLTISVWRYSVVFCCPRHADGTPAPIIEDEEKLEYILQKMREAGRPVVAVEED
jgi:hypothetical protein